MYKELFPLKRSLIRACKRLAAAAMAISVLVAPFSFQTVMAANLEQTRRPQVSLRILGTTDIHSNLYNYNYYQDSKTLEFGFAKTAALIKEARAEATNTLLFDNGDLIQGSALGYY